METPQPVRTVLYPRAPTKTLNPRVHEDEDGLFTAKRSLYIEFQTLDNFAAAAGAGNTTPDGHGIPGGVPVGPFKANTTGYKPRPSVKDGVCRRIPF